MPLDNIGRDMEVLWILGVHGDPVHQLVLVGEVLGVELSLKICHSVFLTLIQATSNLNKIAFLSASRKPRLLTFAESGFSIGNARHNLLIFTVVWRFPS